MEPSDNLRLFEHAFDALDVGICVVDEAGRVVHVNGPLIEMIGLSADQLTPGGSVEHLLLHIGKNDEHGAVDAGERVAATSVLLKTTRPSRFKHQLADGRNLEVVIRPLPAGGWMLVLRDVTDAKRKIDELENQRRRSEDFLSASADWLWETDSQHRYTFLSQDIEVSTGQSSEFEHGTTRLDHREDGNTETDWDEHQRILDAHLPFRDFVYLRKPRARGDRRWVRTSGVPVFDEGGQFLGYRGVSSDVTEIMEAELAAQKHERRFRDLVEVSIQGVFIHRNWKLLFANQAMATMLGYDSVEELMALDVIDSFFDPMDVSWLRNRTAERLSGEPLRSAIELTYRRRDGKMIATQHMAKVVEWDGEPAIMATVVDIQERKQFELELQSAKERAEAANHAKTSFLALMSHELRTPLNAILGFSQILRDGVLGPMGNDTYLEYARDIYDSGSHLLHIINDILDISKIEAEAEDIEEDSIDLDDLLSTSVRLIEPFAKDNGVELRGPEDSQHIRINADETKMKQILINLLNNAVKFTPAGGEVVLSSEIVEAGDLVLKVSDTGIGMSAEDIVVALTPFGQAEASTNGKYQGTGLGLPIARKLAELQGGKLEVESVPGVGTTVTVTVPSERIGNANLPAKKGAVA